ncbi:MAG: SLC13 family permease, partial [Pseudomonadales bacterium]|nr:SLC13 family permease [Pseudomonadales bacterium]
MNQDQIVILVIVLATMVTFFWGRWRHDLVALVALIACVLAELVPAGQAFAGLGHPAVITVASVLILSEGLRNTGVIDTLAHRVLPSNAGVTLGLLALTGLGAVLSAFMNNVGAMALLMPIAIQLAAKHEITPGKLLMPLSFATILGGMTTLIGTPPNIIVSGFRANTGASSFGMFDFTPVGLSIGVAGVLLVSLVGWRLVPRRENSDVGSFDTGTYLTEVHVTEKSKANGMTIREAEEQLLESDAQIVGMVRYDLRIFTPLQGRMLKEGDILVIEAEPESLASALSVLGLELEEDKDAEDADNDDPPSEGKDGHDGETIIREMVAMPHSMLVGQSVEGALLRDRYGINLLAISRQGRRTIRRLRSTEIQAGDVLLLQGPPGALSAFSTEFNTVPLAERSVGVHDTGKATIALLVMGLAIGCTAVGVLPAAVAFVAAVVLFVLFKVIPVTRLYDSVDWSVIVLLGALLPVAGAMASTGAADLIATSMLENIARGDAVIALALILVVTMTLSDFMNNAATAAVMCPIAIGVASPLGANPDSFLLAVALGASCA